MKRWNLVAIGLAVYALGVIATAPATLIDVHLSRISHGKLRIVETQGTLWSGSGQIEMRDAGGRAGVVKSVAWRILPESLLRGHLVCEVVLEQALRPFPVTLSFSGFTLANVDLNLPATVLGLGVPKFAPLGLTGELMLHVDNLSYEAEETQGSVTLQWLDAGSVLTPISPLGHYEMKLNSKGGEVHAQLQTIEGPLQLDGKGYWVTGTSPEFLAVAHVLPEHQQQLAPLLRLIAVERVAGSFELQLN